MPQASGFSRSFDAAVVALDREFDTGYHYRLGKDVHLGQGRRQNLDAGHFSRRGVGSRRGRCTSSPRAVTVFSWICGKLFRVVDWEATEKNRAPPSTVGSANQRSSRPSIGHLDHSGRTPVVTENGFPAASTARARRPRRARDPPLDSGSIRESDANDLNYKTVALGAGPEAISLPRAEANNGPDPGGDQTTPQEGCHELNVGTITKPIATLVSRGRHPPLHGSRRRPVVPLFRRPPLPEHGHRRQRDDLDLLRRRTHPGVGHHLITAREDGRTTRMAFTGASAASANRSSTTRPRLLSEEAERDVDLVVMESTTATACMRTSPTSRHSSRPCWT